MYRKVLLMPILATSSRSLPWKSIWEKLNYKENFRIKLFLASPKFNRSSLGPLVFSLCKYRCFNVVGQKIKTTTNQNWSETESLVSLVSKPRRDRESRQSVQRKTAPHSFSEESFHRKGREACSFWLRSDV